MSTYGITQESLVAMLKDYDLRNFASIKTVTDPLARVSKKTKQAIQEATGSAVENIRKFTYLVIGLGYNYDQLVENRLVKEGSEPTFDKGESWHIPYEGSTTIRVNPKNPEEKYLYVSCIANNTPKTNYFDIVKGVSIDKEIIKQYLPKKSIPENQGLENPIIVRTYKMSNVKELIIGGNTFQVQ